MLKRIYWLKVAVPATALLTFVSAGAVASLWTEHRGLVIVGILTAAAVVVSLMGIREAAENRRRETEAHLAGHQAAGEQAAASKEG